MSTLHDSSNTQANAKLCVVVQLLILCIGGIVLSEKAQISSNFGKKRKLNRDSWQGNQRKRRRQHGLEYFDRDGKKHNGVQDPSPNKVCKRRSCDLEGCKFSHEEKMRIHLQFWPGKKQQPEFRVNNYDIQQGLIQGYINWEIPSQKVVEGQSRRQATWQYTLPLSNGRKVKVCSSTFEDVLQISGTRLSYIQRKIKNGDLIILDKRGTNSISPNVLSDEAKQIVQDHFLSFPRFIPHYTRKENHPLQEYLDPELTIANMYRGYVDMMTAAGDNKIVSRTVYYQLFIESGLKIGSQKTDVCDLCTKLQFQLKAIDSSNVVGIQEVERQIEEHQVDAELAYKELENDTILSTAFPEEYFTICIDVQQIMLSPKLECSDNFYNSKFPSYNCAVTNASDDTTTMFFYNSTEGKKGEHEISSILHKYITTNFEPLQEGQQRVLNIFSDRCIGQNNNYLNVALYKYCLSLGYFSEIQQKFLFTGHSFLPCDRAFAFIEKASQRRMIYSPDDWIDIIKAARISNPFKVVEMKLNDFVDFSGLKELIPKPNSMNVTKYKCIAMFSVTPHIYKTKVDFKDTTEFELHVILEPSRKRIANRNNWSAAHLNNFNYKVFRTEFLRPSPQTLASLKKLLSYIPMAKQTFFNNLIRLCEERQLLN